MVHKDPEGYVSDSGSASSVDDDHDFGDWRSDGSNPAAATLALFTDAASGERKSFSSPIEALNYAKTHDKCDLAALVARFQLDTLQVIRLINHVRRNNLTPEQVNGITADSAVLSDDDELKPVPGFEDDGLLQVDFDLLATDVGVPDAESSDRQRIRELEEQLATARAAFDELRTMHASTLGLSSTDLTESSGEQLSLDQRSQLASASLSHSAARTRRGANDAEDDVLYFDSYSTNSIHQTMITDSARTLSYAQFLLHPANAHLIRGKTVMDVGCGTGILSLFAARAGAKQVIAIDASAIVERAKQNVEANGFGHIVKVHRGKLEDLADELKQYEGKVDMLVSEWMGYFLLYENMLPSVLVARDRYLHPTTGVLAPNRMTMHLAAFESPALLQTKLKFWDDVHGFNMASMTTGLLDEAFVDVLDPNEVVSDSFIFADLDLPSLPAKQPEPSSDFTLTIQKDASEVHGFISWFDTFFFPSARVPAGASSACPAFNLQPTDVHGLDLRANQTTATPESATLPERGGEGELVAFSTSPYSKETHWQQTLFVLKTPLGAVKKGDTIKGRIVVLQDSKHSRQLECELHYLHVPADAHSDRRKKVETQLVQVYMVR
ncbi:hypothetical protein EX895_002327 [Sporisorium graminicola]|uniref:type I protein arginine methyltransferase n=1 Tax=Sporisorium graminicola TaxID=280036 RepID=A0A4U7KWS1_9BASI|nr:hypothetical protein EX895_002327 [Sporisorium graminicola]TKY88696.1 hypothetical protein EX895_002327 [Sporisorium graminicola]